METDQNDSLCGDHVRSLPDATRSSLICLVKTSDADGWSRMINLYFPLVYSWCRRGGLQSADAADVAQEVFQSVLVHIVDFRRDRPGDSFRKWLRTIAKNKICDFWRRRNREACATGGTHAHLRLENLPEPKGESLHKENEHNEINQVFQRALELIQADFETRTWSAFWQVAMEGRRPVDVAADLKITTNAVYLAKSKILRRIREEFGELIDEGMLGGSTLIDGKA